MALKRDLMLVAGGRLSTALITLVAIRAVTTYLTPAQYGELALLLTVQMFCGLFLVNPIGQHINLHTHAWWDDGTLAARLNSYQKYILAVSLVGGIAVLGMNKQDSDEHLLWAAVAMLAMITAGTWNATLIPMLNMLGFRAASVFWGIVSAVVALASSIFLVVWLPSATAWFAGQALGMTLGALGAKYVFRRHASQQSEISRLSPAPELIDKQTVLSYCLPLALATGLMWLQLSGYRIVIEHYWGMAQLGFLTIGLAVAGQIAAQVESFVMQFVYPHFFCRISGADTIAGQAAMSDLLNALGPSYVLLAGAIVLGAPHLLLLLVDAKYAEAVIFVSLGAAIESCRMLGNLVGHAAQITRQTSSLAAPYAMGALTVWGLIIGFGGEGLSINYAGWSLVAGALVMLLVMLYMMYRQVRFTIAPLPWAIATFAMLVMVMFGIDQQTPHRLVDSVLKLAGIAAVVAATQIVLLWKNRAMSRLLSAQLRRS